MEIIPDWENRTCFVWAIERPVTKRPRTSPTFKVKRQDTNYEDEYYLTAKKSNNEAIQLFLNGTCYGYAIFYRNMYVHLQDKQGRALPLYKYTNFDKDCNKICIWEYTESQITKYVPDFMKDGVLIFVISFTRSHNYTLTVECYTDDKSVQTDDTENVKTDDSENDCQFLLRNESQNSSHSCLEGLSKDFGRLMEETEIKSLKGLEPDLELVCGDQILKVHKNIILCRSKLLGDVRETEVKSVRADEPKLPRFELKGMKSEIFKDFVRYLYTGTLSELTDETAKLMYQAGHKYGVVNLVKRCSQFMQGIMDSGNACDLLRLAHEYDDQHLKEIVIGYIIEQEITSQDNYWLPFCEDQPRLANQVLNRIVKSQNKNTTVVSQCEDQEAKDC